MITKDNRKTTNNNKRQASFVADLQQLAIKNKHNVKIYATKTAVVFEHKFVSIKFEDNQVLSRFTNQSNFKATPENTAKYYLNRINQLGAKVKKTYESFGNYLAEALCEYARELNYNYLDLKSLAITDINYNFEDFEARLYCANKQGYSESCPIGLKVYIDAYVEDNTVDFTSLFDNDGCIGQLFSKIPVQESISFVGLNSYYTVTIESDSHQTKIIKEINYPDFSNFNEGDPYNPIGITKTKEVLLYKNYYEVEAEFKEHISDMGKKYEDMLDYYDNLKEELNTLIGVPDNKYLEYLSDKTGEDFVVAFMSKEDVDRHQVFGEDGSFGIKILPEIFEFSFLSDNHIIVLNPDNYLQGKGLQETLEDLIVE